MRLVLVFVDGIGVGPPGPHNPLSVASTPLLGVHHDRLRDGVLTGLPDGWEGSTLDATMGVDGLPQSATGQTTLFCGINAPARLGHHQAALPGPTLRKVLLEHSILKRVREGGLDATFANAYRPAFFDGIRDGLPRRASASTVANWAAGIPFRTLDDLRRGEALYHDFSRSVLVDKGFGLEAIGPETAGRHLAGLTRTHHLTLYEHFLTDLIGHKRVAWDPVRHLEGLDALILALVDELDPAEHGVIVTSDHGNFEDLSHRAHTRYPVPLLVWGSARSLSVREPGDLTAVTPGILELLGLS